MDPTTDFLGGFGSFAVVLVKSTAIMALAFLAARLLRHASGTVRHRVWTVALALLAVVLFIPAPAQWRVPVPVAPVLPAMQHIPLHGTFSAAASQPIAVSTPAPVPPVLISRTTRAWKAFTAVSWTHWLMWLWYAGGILVTVQLVLARVQLSRLSRRARVAGEELAAETAQLAADAGITRPVTLLISDDVDVPLTWGIFNARILLPNSYSEWAPARMTNVLRHELAHVARLDVLTQVLADIACMLYWFNPLVWMAAMQMRIEREVACDEAVLAGGARPSDYASDLLDLAINVRFGSLHRAGVAMAGCPRFEERLQSILDARPRRGLSRVALTALLVIAAAALPLAAFQVAQVEKAKTWPIPGKEVQQFQYAVTAGYYDQMVKLGTADPSLINSRAREGQTPLYLAATSWSKLGLAEARWLIEHGADINMPASGLMGETPLMACVRSPEMVRFLLDRGADIEAADIYGRTALDQAAMFRGAWYNFPARDDPRAESAKILLDRGAKVSFPTALRLPDVATVRKYLTDDPSLVHKTYPGAFGGQTALVFAITARNRDRDKYQPVVDTILPYLSEPTLCEAAMLGRVDLVAKYLDEDPSRINRKKDQGYYTEPLACAVLGNERGSVLYLLNRGAKPDENMLFAALSTDADTVRLLLSAGAAKDIDKKALDGFAEQAEKRGKKDIAEVLRAQAR